MWVLIGLLAVVFFIFYMWVTWDYGHWKKQKVPQARPTFPFGNIAEAVLMRKTMGEVFKEIYDEFPGEGAVGYYMFGEASLLLKDPELIKTVLVKDFSKFHDNGFQVNIKVDPLFGINPFVIQGHRWKNIRGVYTPTMTPSKLKSMVKDMTTICQTMIDYLNSQKGKELEAKQVCALFTMDVVAKVGYGCEGNSFVGEKDSFRGATEGKIFSSELPSNIANLCALFAPKLPDYFGFRILSKGVEDFFVQMVRVTRDYRREKGIKRNDLFQHLIDTKDPEDKSKPAYTDLELAGHCMTLYLNGNETSAVLLSFVLYELAQHPEYQDKLRDEIMNAGETMEDFTYEKLESLPYLDMVVSETVRLHPPIQTMARLCTEDTTLVSDGREYSLKKGEMVMVPILALHHDPQYFPDPQAFNPDRFSEENKQSIVKFAYLPFGEGPRICIGMKFALLEVKLGLVSLLRNFVVEPREFTTKPFPLDPMYCFVRNAKDGLWLKFNPIN